MSTPATRAETVIKNANIITMDTNRPRVQALAMGNSRFIGLGCNEDVEEADWPKREGNGPTG